MKFGKSEKGDSNSNIDMVNMKKIQYFLRGIAGIIIIIVAVVMYPVDVGG